MVEYANNRLKSVCVDDTIEPNKQVIVPIIKIIKLKNKDILNKI